MRFLVLSVLIFSLEAVYSQSVTVHPYFTSEATKSVIFTVKKNLVVSCNVTADAGTKQDDVTVQWKKDNTALSEIGNLKNRFKQANDGWNYTLTVTDSTNNDVGNWSCHVTVGDQTVSAEIQAATSIAVRIKTENINVVEEEKLRIECSVLGNPYPTLSWKIETSNYNDSVFDERVKIDSYTDDSGKLVENGLLIIEKVNKEDRGLYYCIATNKFWAGNEEESKSMIRVKDKYAALWPFLGICAEVIVLCAVIIIYEKKRNKTELEESDTDQSPDQKNTPDRGKDANLRHRQ